MVGMFSGLLDGVVIYLARLATYDPWVTVVQLFLIGVVVWLAMRFLRGTRGARLVKGAALVLALVYLTVRLLPKSDEWTRIEFLYGRFLFFAFVAAVVAFQPELRRALMQLGQPRIFKGGRGQVQAMVDALMESVAYLSKNKIGAVVAIERSVQLGSLMETGTIMDAHMTASLLNTIFWPGSALHDMGVVIREGRIAAAGCQFPLAESDEVDPSLGSRHRAALGLAQDSDAAVVVVSEETGRISIAYEGQLYLGLEIDNLRQMLLDLLTTHNHRPRKSRREGSA
ncbi:MAG: diadenylate cyclase [Planctomycetes bacterium]|jgi:diadenylate cyclase|nr:diadenylate cyclase [Planctomycetota bacterium]